MARLAHGLISCSLELTHCILKAFVFGFKLFYFFLQIKHGIHVRFTFHNCWAVVWHWFCWVVGKLVIFFIEGLKSFISLQCMLILFKYWISAHEGPFQPCKFWLCNWGSLFEPKFKLIGSDGIVLIVFVFREDGCFNLIVCAHKLTVYSNEKSI